MSYQRLESVIYLPLYRNIVNKKDLSKLFFSCVYGFYSVLLLIYLIFNYESLLQLLLLVLIFFVSFVIALIMYRSYIKSKQMVYAPANMAVREAVAYYNLRDMEILKEGLKEKDFSILHNVKIEQNSNIRLDIFVSMDKRFVAAQLFQFVPYRYKAITPIYYYYDEIALNFMEYFDNDFCEIKL